MKRAAIVILLLLVGTGCYPAVDGVASVGVPAQDSFLSERDATNAAEQLMQFAMDDTNKWIPIQFTTTNGGRAYLESDAKVSNKGIVRLSKYGRGKPIDVRINSSSNNWITASLPAWP
jgi:hypothetical protein